MRVGVFLRALARRHRVAVVGVPVAGALPHDPRSDRLLRSAEWIVDLGLPDTAGYERSLRDSLLDPFDRRRLSEAGELPVSVHAALPGRRGEILGLISEPVALVHVMRTSLLPLGASLARRFRSALTVDLDDDDAQLAATVGDARAAQQWSSVLQAWLADAAVATLASPVEVRSMRDRWPDVRFEVAPNAVALGEPPSLLDREPARKANRRPAILVVANFTYGPNLDGLQWFVAEVLPLLGTATLCHIVGNIAPDVTAAIGSRTVGRTELRVQGFVGHAELLEAYRDADVVVAPIRVGGGTRTKLLEAFAAGRAVVTTTAGAAGLDIVDGEQALVADSSDAFAEAIERLLIDEATRRRLARAARRWVERFDVETVAVEVEALLCSVTDRTVSAKATRART